MGFARCLNINRTKAKCPLRGTRENGRQIKSYGVRKEHKDPPPHLVTSPGDFGEFTNAGRLAIFNVADLDIMSVGAREWGKYYQRHRRKAAQITIPVLRGRGKNGL